MSNPVAVENNNGKGMLVKIGLGAAVAVALGGVWYQQHEQFNAVRGELSQTKRSMEQMKGSMESAVAASKREADESIAKLNEKMAAEVAAAKRAAVTQASRAQANAAKETGKALEAVNAKNAELVSQIDAMKKDSETKAAAVGESLNGIKGDVGAVRTEVASTRTELDKTILDLRRMTGDMGIMSGLIATNSQELDALKKLGERDYFEFTLTKTAEGAVRKVGGVQLALKKVDVKRNKFTMDVLADDRKVEKKDKTVNEPVQFYTSQARMPFELVINQIGKDKVSGYLSVPKVKMIAQR